MWAALCIAGPITGGALLWALGNWIAERKLARILN